jgi:outer membrane protein OmpA-like peptidoglycan-associated protein/tetratricopeptide (TPR) repeat protein
MKQILMFAMLLLLQISVFSQQVSDLNSAENFYKKGEFYNAIINYEIYLGIRKPTVAFTPYSKQKKNFSRVDSSLQASNSIIENSKLVTNAIAYHLGESYRLLYHYLRAESCYGRVLKNNSKDSSFSLARYYYGICLRSNSKFDEAKIQFSKFIEENNADSKYIALGNKELATLNFISKELKSINQYQYSIKKLGGNITQAEGAYAPVFFKDTLIFTSARIVDTVNKYSKSNSHVNHLFYNTIDPISDSINGKSSLIQFPSKLSINEATASFVKDRSNLYFSRSVTQNGKTVNSIYISFRTKGNNWTEPTKLDNKVNKPGYNSIQPSISEDGKYLLFASDRNGGIGGYDIWCAVLEDNSVASEVFNLNSINTSEDEQAPYYHEKSKALVFASKGYDGMGGFDIYTADGTLKNLQKPVNLGYPVNSPKDDIYFFSTSDNLLKKAYISSDRSSDCCLEVFSIAKLIKKKPKKTIEGLIVDCDSNKPIAGNINVTTNSKEFKITSNNSGEFTISNVDSVTKLDFSKYGYTAKSNSFSADVPVTNDTVFKISICLNPIPVEIPKTVEQVKDSINFSDKLLLVYFEFDKADVKNESAPVLDEVVSVLKKYPTLQLILEINGYTDAKGSEAYNLRLGKARADACKQYLVNKGIDAGRMGLKSYGKSVPVAPDTINNQDNPEGRALNRRVEIKIKASAEKK